MGSHRAVVEAYVEGFRRSDHEAILACLTDDVEWVLHGYRALQGKAAFDGEIESDAAVGSPTLHLDRLIEEGDTVVAIGSGEMTLKEAGASPSSSPRSSPSPAAGSAGWRPSTSPRRPVTPKRRPRLGDVADAAPITNYSYQVANDSGRPGGEMGADRDDTGDPRRDPRQQDQARRTVDRAARRWDGGGRRDAHADR